MRLVDAVVDDPDLHAVARRGERRAAPELVGADERRATVERDAVPPSDVHVLDALDAGELRDITARERDGEAVQHDGVAPPDLRGGDPGANAPFDGLLRRCARPRGSARLVAEPRSSRRALTAGVSTRLVLTARASDGASSVTTTCVATSSTVAGAATPERRSRQTTGRSHVAPQ